MVNRDEIARRIAYRKGYNIGDVQEVLEGYEDVIVEALLDREEVKHGSLYKIELKEFAEKLNAWDGITKKTYIKPAKVVPKFKPLKKIKDIVHQPINDKE